MPKIEQLRSLVTQFLRAESEPDCDERDRGHYLYQRMLREARLTADDIDWIDREIARRTISDREAVVRPKHGNFRDLPLADIIYTLRGTTPMNRLYRAIRKVPNWSSDARDWIKAYVMACFTEITYLHLTKHELTERDRYKIFTPSLVHDYLLKRGPRIDLVAVMAQVADIRIEIIETGRFVYMVVQVNTFVVIGVRGTVGWRDWLLDIDAVGNPASSGFYHRGFHDEAELGLPLLVQRTADQRPLYITGHSLGGAVASILSQIWPGRPAQTPYVFASPRFGTRAAARRQPRYAHIRPTDLVPHLPPRFLGDSDEGARLETLPAAEAQRTGWSVLRRGIVKGFDFSMPHSMEGYRVLLGTSIGERFGERAYIAALDRIDD